MRLLVEPLKVPRVQVCRPLKAVLAVVRATHFLSPVPVASVPHSSDKARFHDPFRLVELNCCEGEKQLLGEYIVRPISNSVVPVVKQVGIF